MTNSKKTFPSRALTFAALAILCSCVSRKPSNAITSAVDKRDYANAFQLAKSGAAANDPAAKFYLGRLYDLGLGVQDNFQTALEYYKEAAAAGHVRAKVFIAGSYIDRGNLVKNAGEIRRLFKEAADQGDLQAKYLSMLVSEGEPDEKARIAAMTDSAAIGDPYASLVLAGYYDADDHGHPKDAKRALQYLMAAADSNAVQIGARATAILYSEASKLGAAPDQVMKYVYRYSDTATLSGVMLVLGPYLHDCGQVRSRPGCDPVRVAGYMKVGERLRLFPSPPVPPEYLKSLTEAQMKEADRFAGEFKKVKLPLLPVEYYVLPGM